MTLVTYNDLDETKIEKYFVTGDYRKVLNLALGNMEVLKIAKNCKFVAASLCALGKPEKAEAILRESSEVFDQDDLIENACHLSRGYTRAGNYDRARKLLINNLRQLRHTKNSRSKFYIYFGQSEFQFFKYRYNKALSLAIKAQEQAMEEEFYFGIVQAKLLQGRCLIRTGRYGQGIAMLGDALKIAKSLEAHPLTRTIQFSILSAKLQYGKETGLDIRNFIHKVEEIGVQEDDIKCSLLIELAKDLILRGKPFLAIEALQKAGETIFNGNLRREEVSLYLRYAYLHYLDGNDSQALRMVTLARSGLRPGVDSLLELETLGIEAKITNRIDKGGDKVRNMLKKMGLLSSFTGEVINLRILGRLGLSRESMHKSGEDVIGDLKDKIKIGKGNKSSENLLILVNEIIKTGFVGFLREVIDCEPGKLMVVRDLRPDTYTFIRGAAVEILDKSDYGPVEPLIIALMEKPRGFWSLDEAIKLLSDQMKKTVDEQTFNQMMGKLNKLLSPLFGGIPMLTNDSDEIRPTQPINFKRYMRTK